MIEEKVVQLITNSILEVYVNEEFQGTGFFVLPDGKFVTCAHIVFPELVGSYENIPSIAPVTVLHKGGSYVADFLPEFSDLTRDLAVCKARTSSPVPFVPLGDDFNPFDNFLIFGFQKHKDGYRCYPVKGSISGPTTQYVDNNQNMQDLIVLETHNLEPGISGAPVLNIRTFRVVGIAKRKLSSGGIPVGGYAIPTQTLIRAFRGLQEENYRMHQEMNLSLGSKLLKKLITNNIATTTERYTVRSVHELTAGFWTNILIHYDRLLSNPSCFKEISEAIGIILSNTCEVVIDPILIGCEPIHEREVITKVSQDLGLPLNEVSFKSCQAAIIGTLNPFVAQSLKAYIDVFTNLVIIFGPNEPEIKRNFGESSRQVTVMISTNDLTSLDSLERWKMING